MPIVQTQFNEPSSLISQDAIMRGTLPPIEAYENSTVSPAAYTGADTLLLKSVVDDTLL